MNCLWIIWYVHVSQQTHTNYIHVKNDIFARRIKKNRTKLSGLSRNACDWTSAFCVPPSSMHRYGRAIVVADKTVSWSVCWLVTCSGFLHLAMPNAHSVFVSALFLFFVFSPLQMIKWNVHGKRSLKCKRWNNINYKLTTGFLHLLCAFEFSQSLFVRDLYIL